MNSRIEAILLRKIILNIHMYAGLLCFSYLILFGITTLNFNHPFDFTKGPVTTTTWSVPMQIPGLKATEGKKGAELNQTRTENNGLIRQAIGTFCYPFVTPESNWKDAKTYHARLVRPGSEYEVDVQPDAGTATITLTRKGVWAVLRDLHGQHNVFPGSMFASSWKWYSELCTLTVVGAGMSGIYLWTRRRNERRIGLVLIGTAGALSLSLMLLITFYG